MPKSIIIFTKNLPPDLLATLQSRYTVTIATPSKDRPAFLAALPTAHGLLGSSAKMGPELLASAQNLQVISAISAGVDNFDIPYLTSRKIALTHTPDVLTETTADTGFALLMAAARRVVELAQYVKTGRWTAGLPEEFFGTDIHHKTLGIIGFGRIGQAVARRGHFGFGMKILYTSRTPNPAAEKELSAQFLPLADLLPAADFICVTIPLSPQTTHLIGPAQFALMRPSTIFINIARGKVVDEPALIHALATRQIRAAGLDVFETEPLPLTSPLLKMPNVIATPHIGSATTETRRAMAQLAVDNLIAVLEGQRPKNTINPEVWT
jgi:phosphogluconate 2-dehydrogenase